MEFHLIRNGKQEGPFSVEELSQQGITPESEVWAPGMADWKQAGDVPELTAILQRAEFEASQQAARAAENQPAMGQPYEPAVNPGQVPPQVPPRMPVQDDTKKKRGCTPWLIAGLILAILFATMVFTCPDRSDHEAAIQEVTKAWVGDKVDEQLGGITGIGGVFGDLINKALKELTGKSTDKIISSYLDVKNYVVCSVGTVSLKENGARWYRWACLVTCSPLARRISRRRGPRPWTTMRPIITLPRHLHQLPTPSMTRAGTLRKMKLPLIPGCCPTA